MKETIKYPSSQELLDFQDNKRFSAFTKEVQVGTTTAEPSFELKKDHKGIRPSVRFLENGEVIFCDCTEIEKKLLQSVVTEFQSYRKTFKAKLLKLI